jgi:hypothetical protein
MAPSSRKRRAKQTRLTFTPLISSSPASKKMEKEHGQRTYASMGFEGGKRKRKAIEEELDGEEEGDSKFVTFFYATQSR